MAIIHLAFPTVHDYRFLDIGGGVAIECHPRHRPFAYQDLAGYGGSQACRDVQILREAPLQF